MENKPLYTILHHTGDTSLLPQLRKVDEWHRYRFGMFSKLGYWIGYHYFIERDGSLTQTRADNEEGAHTKGKNSESLGICLAGNFDIQRPTEAQIRALNKLLHDIEIVYSPAEFPLYHHSKFSDTHCPGAYFTTDGWKIHSLQRKLNYLQRLLLWITHQLKR